MDTDENEAAIARALKALPDVAPPADGWSRILRARAVDRPRRRPSASFALATVALALATLALLPLLGRGPPPPEPADAGLAADPVADLAARSADLEQLLAALPAPRSARASTALTAAALEDRIALVDERLTAPGDAPLSASATRALMRERVVLLDSLVRVRYATSVGQTL
ncbi:MAG TPA: hypothetical protein VMT92_00075 [Steroidobacteraceae bacterium]|nr:hypothetical protein [Steroidobacteraceae bacterium]